MNQLQNAAGLVAAAGHGSDTELAHFSRDELNLIDQFRGGKPDINPSTGLPQYGWFGDLLKGIVRAAAAVGGGMVAGPAGAAAGAGIGTKLTGGSWNDALKGAALSGIGSFAAQGLGGGGWDATKAWGSSAGTGGMNAADKIGATMSGGQGGVSSVMSAPIGSAAPSAANWMAGQQALSAPGAASGLGSQFLNVAKSAPGLIAALGPLSQPFDHPQVAPIQGSSGPSFSVAPMDRTQIPYEGDPLTYGQHGGHKFYDTINPYPIYGDPVPGGVRYADGGDVPGYNAGSAGLAGPYSAALQQAAMQGYMAAKKGGAIPHEGQVSGPGTGTSDEVPALLSNGEHVFTKAETDSLGGGDNDVGQQRMYKLRKAIRQKGPAVMNGIGNVKVAPRGVR